MARNLTNGGDGIHLSAGGVSVDGYDYPETAVEPGKSTSLDPDSLDANSNDLDSAWCPGVTTYGDGDFGTPAAGNPQCP